MHNYGTRIANDYQPHFCHTNIKQFTILYQGPKIWNSLPGSIINSSSYLNFKKNMLKFLLKKTELVMPHKHYVRLFRLMIWGPNISSVVSWGLLATNIVISILLYNIYNYIYICIYIYIYIYIYKV